MSVVQLATAADVVAALGRALTADESVRVDSILDKASELFRDRSGQQFTPAVSSNRFRVVGGKVRLKQRPVTAVTAVTTDDGTTVTFTRFAAVLTVALTSSEFVTVTYAHGAAEVPDIVRLCIADVAKMVLTVSKKAAEGVTQHSESTGPYNRSETYATWAVGGATRLSPDDLAIADTFKVKYGSVIVLSP